MICGVDTYHETEFAKANSVSGFVASINATFTKWYSKVIIQNRREGNVNEYKSFTEFKCTQISNYLLFSELVHGLVVTVRAALDAYKNSNNKYPDRIVIYR